MSSFHHSGAVTQAADAAFVRLAHECLTDYLRLNPDRATAIGEHAYDDQLPDLSLSGRDELARVLEERLEQLDAVDDTELGPDALLDFETLRAALSNAAFETTDVARHTWDPVVWNPGSALWSLISRPTLEPPDLLRAVGGRLAAIPEWLATARITLGDMSRIHVETAISQLAGTKSLVDTVVAHTNGVDDCGGAALQRPRDLAVAAIDEHIAWLGDRLARGDAVGHNPRFGEAKFAASVWHRLDGGPSVDDLRRIAHRAFEDTAQAMVEVAAMYLGVDEHKPQVVQRALDHIAASGPVTADTILPMARATLAQVTEFARERDFVSIPPDAIDVVAMPEIHRGVAVAYCDPPGPLETKSLPTLFCVAPPPDAWSDDRKASFYREYNAHMLHSLSIHEGVPGHALQLAHARAALPLTSMRHVLPNLAFAEGWAVYTEELFSVAEYPGIDMPNGDLAWQLTFLKTRMRGIANLILDIGVHVDEFSEAEGMDLLVRRAFQEEGEAAGKWRRAQLSAGQLSTYFAGYLSVHAIADDLRAMHPEFSDRQVHDTMLAFGTPSTRVLRLGLGLPELLA